MFQASPTCLEHLGWTRILTAVASCAATDPGRDAATRLPFVSDAARARTELARVGSLMRLLDDGGSLPLAGLAEVRVPVRRCVQGGIANPEDLLAIATTTRAVSRVRQHLSHHSEAVAELSDLRDRLPDLGMLAEELLATFDDSGGVRDDASPELLAARRRLAKLHQQVKERLERYIVKAEIKDQLQDSYYTVRDERYVLPVNASFQGQVPGIIHGTSNTGQSVYIEPSEFIQANNEIKVAEAEVEREVLRVLKIRAEWVAGEAEAIIEGAELLVRLDLLQARALLGRRLNATIPTLSDDGRLALFQARNPVLALAEADVVANDIVLEPDQAFLVVTGPNAGGKTVTLNTVGLLVLMAHAAIPLPVDPHSHVVFFDSVAAVVGDAQDIDRNLSTFSGHMVALKEVLAEAHAGTLVLLDEIVVATEPTQGAALAIAVLEELATRGARGFVTTHHERLKTLAYEDPRFGNASVGVDRRSQRPTYQLQIGEAGSSNPLEVATQLGLPPGVVGRARELLGSHESVAKAVERLRFAREEAEEAQHQAEQMQQELEREREALRAIEEQLRYRADVDVATLREQALSEARRALETIRGQVHALQKASTMRELERVRSEVVEIERATQRRLEEEPRPRPPGGDHKPKKKKSGGGRVSDKESSGPRDGGDLESGALRPALPVWVRTLDKPGHVVEVRGKSAMVAVGGMKLTVKTRDLGRLADVDAPKKRAARPADDAPERPARQLDERDYDTPPPREDRNSVDVRGMRRDEIADRVEPLLDRAYRDTIDAIWVIHGHGTGALRDEVRVLLRNSTYVDRWRPGKRHEGGDGVSIAWLRSD